MKLLFYVFIFLLILLSIIDILKKYIPLNLVIILGNISLLIFVIKVINGEISLIGGLIASLPGIIMIITSCIYPEDLGIGDGIVLVIVQLGRPLVVCCLSLFITCIAIFIISFVIKVINAWLGSGNVKIPLIPFITLGFFVSEYIL